MIDNLHNPGVCIGGLQWVLTVVWPLVGGLFEAEAPRTRRKAVGKDSQRTMFLGVHSQ